MAKSTNLTATGVVATRGALAQVVHIVPHATNPGTVTLRSGGAEGDVLLALNVPGGTGAVATPLGEGIYFPDGIHATLADVTSATVVYAVKP